MSAQRLRIGHRSDKDWDMGWKLPALTVVICVIALTLAGVVLGRVIGGPAGALIGAIPGALAAVLAGFVPTIVDTARRRREEPVRREQEAAVAQAKWDMVGEPIAEPADRGPTALLRPEREIVEFTGREAELDMLRSWCTSADARSARTIIGAGGVGKTRLALKIAAEWESGGGEWRRVDAGQEGQAVVTARGLTSGPVLLVVDYAETRADLDAMLRAVLADPGPIRVLLVARALGEWWDRLVEKSVSAVGALLTEAEPIRLAEQINQEMSDAALVDRAIPQFARALKCTTPERVEFELPPHRVPVLVLHIAALVAVLRFRDNSAASLRLVVAQGLLDELLDHEARYWRRTVIRAGLPEDGALFKPAVAAAALLGADNLAEAADLLVRVPDLVDATQAERRSWARWLYGLYPPDREGRLGSLQPDLLAETHVVEQLAADAELAEACLHDLPMSQAEHALTMLARAWAHHDDAEGLIADALNADLAHLAVPAAQVALQTRGAVGVLLASALQDSPAPQDALIHVAEALPYPSVVLARAHLVVTLRVQRSVLADADPATVAGWSDRAGVLFSQMGRPADALPLTEEAVATYRELAAANPERYCPALAGSLSNLGVRFSELGRPADALPPEQEAIAIRRELAAADPGRYRPALADSLSNLGIWFSALRRPDDALIVTEEGVAIYRELAAADPGRYRPALADSLANLGVTFSALGRPDDALIVTDEGVAIYRELAAADPDRYRPALARFLANLGVTFSALGRPDDALIVTEEGVAIYRELAAADPGRYRPDLADSLSNLGVRLSELGRPADGLPVTEEAAAIYRELAAADPGRYRPDLAHCLHNLGSKFSALGRAADGLLVTEEAAAAYRELAAADPGRYRPVLAGSLNNLGVRLSELGRPADALPVTEEAAAAYRELAAADPGRYRPDFARCLHNLSSRFSALGRAVDALPPELEAAAAYRELAAADPGRYRPALARCLHNLRVTFSTLGRSADALPVTEEATAIRRELVADNPSRYRSGLASSLANLAAILSALDRHSDAEQLRIEADSLKNSS